MATQKPQPITYVYKEINEGKYKGVKHYELIESKTTPIFSNLLNLSKDRNCAQSMPVYWLRIRQGNKWSNCITGLFKTGYKYIYKGDTQRKKNLVVFKFSDNESTLTLKYFKGYYTNDLSNVLPLIKD